MNSSDPSPYPPHPRSSPRVPGQVVTCGWCGVEVPIPARGRVPKWCSSTCRHRAWEQRRAADSGRSAVEVRDRVIETMKTVTVVEHRTTEAPVLPGPQSADDYAKVLTDLANRIDTGRIYDRDLPTLAPAVNAVAEALWRRHKSTRNRSW